MTNKSGKLWYSTWITRRMVINQHARCSQESQFYPSALSSHHIDMPSSDVKLSHWALSHPYIYITPTVPLLLLVSCTPCPNPSSLCLSLASPKKPSSSSWSLSLFWHGTFQALPKWTPSPEDTNTTEPALLSAVYMHGPPVLNLSNGLAHKHHEKV